MTTNAQRHSFFIAQLARKFTEEQLWDLLVATQKEMHTVGTNQAPALSQRQQEVHDWLCQDGYREAADERLRAERDAAVALAESIRGGDCQARSLAYELKQQAGGLRAIRQRLQENFAALEVLLQKVPKAEER